MQGIATASIQIREDAVYGSRGEVARFSSRKL